MQIVTATDMRRADEDLRHGAPAAASRHFFARLGTRIDVDLLEIDAFSLEKLLRARAVRAPARQINHDLRSAHAPLSVRMGSAASQRQILGAPRGQAAAQIEGFGE